MIGNHLQKKMVAQRCFAHALPQDRCLLYRKLQRERIIQPTFYTLFIITYFELRHYLRFCFTFALITNFALLSLPNKKEV